MTGRHNFFHNKVILGLEEFLNLTSKIFSLTNKMFNNHRISVINKLCKFSSSK